MEFITSLEETKSLARGLAKNAHRGDCFCLTGDLGAGKTEFARAFIREFMGEEVTVASPTFNILQIYERGTEAVYHYDLYRLKDPGELHEISLEDALYDAITLIEWPQIAESMLPAGTRRIHIEILGEDKRKIIVSE